LDCALRGAHGSRSPPSVTPATSVSRASMVSLQLLLDGFDLAAYTSVYGVPPAGLCGSRLWRGEEAATCLTSPESPNLNLEPIERTTMLHSNLQSILTDSWAPLAKKIDALEQAVRATSVSIGQGEELNPFRCSTSLKEVEDQLLISKARCARDTARVLEEGVERRAIDTMRRRSRSAMRDCSEHLLASFRKMSYLSEFGTDVAVLHLVVLPYVRCLLNMLTFIDCVSSMNRMLERSPRKYIPMFSHLIEDVDLINMLADIEDYAEAAADGNVH